MVAVSQLLNDENARLIFDNLSVEVHIWEIMRDDAGQIDNWKLVYANPLALEVWGRSSLEEIRGLTTDEIFGDGAKEHYISIVKKIVDESLPYTFMDFFPNIEKYFKFTSVPLGDYFITTGSDVTDIVRSKEQIEDQNKELELRVTQRTDELERTVQTLNKALDESKKLRDELKQLAIKDPLTNLYNRRYLEEALNAELKRSVRSGHELSVIFFDIDYFKQINDQFGHEVGDMALKEVARMTRSMLRGSDIVCRYGGDEIVIILPETGLEMAVQKADELRNAVIDVKWGSCASELERVTLSFGVAAYPVNGLTSKELLKKADSALLSAKKQGRDRVEKAW